MTNIFLYGTLCDKELLEICLGRSLSSNKLVSAKLENHSVFWVKNRNFPVIKFEHGSFAEGLAVLDLTEHDLEQLDFYEGGFNYELKKASIILKNNALYSKDNTIYAYVYSAEGQSEQLARHLPSRRKKRRPRYARRPRGQESIGSVDPPTP